MSCDVDLFWAEASISYICNQYDVFALDLHCSGAKCRMFRNEAGTPPIGATA